MWERAIDFVCSILVTNKPINDLSLVNKFMRNRGPDATNWTQIDDYHFIHNLLSLCGEFTKQPLIDYDNQIVCIFNGEIYNYTSFGSFDSDGYSLIAAYKKHGIYFPKYLDGEFAVVLLDFANNLLVVSTDTFSTKPLWMGINNGFIGISTYKSGLTAIDFSDPFKCEPNKTLVFKLSPLNKITSFRNVDFSLDQIKTTYDDWIAAFREAIKKRAFHSPRQKVFIGLSSGYDSGAIAQELSAQEVTFRAYTILATEDKDTIHQRHSMLADGEIIELKNTEYTRLKSWVDVNCESYSQRKAWVDENKHAPAKLYYNVKNDQGSIGLAYICELAKRDGCKILFSGQGSDEIISDYGYNGTRFQPHSRFGGLFPDDLNSIFPWESFYGGTQQMYLAKEEHIAGAFGIETRYPFLDKNLVQEFLSLSVELKNSKYKSVVHEYLARSNYPIYENKKIGFQADTNLIDDRY